MELEARFEALDVTDRQATTSQCLPFRSSPHCALSRAQLENVDRFLFRLFDGRSEGYNDEIWVESRDAALLRPDRDIDILSRPDTASVATMLSRHLWWEGENEEEDNLVSWTSSFLFVLLYALYRSRHHGTDLKSMFICMVDTTCLPADVFLRDMDLIDAYAPLCGRLATMQRMRRGPHYFGEFLSQGALRVDGHCTIVCVRDIVITGLFALRPELDGFETRPPKWAAEMVRLRNLDASGHDVIELDRNLLEIAEQTGNLFGVRWKWPIFLACLTLKPWQNLELQVMEALERPRYSDLKKSVLQSDEVKSVAVVGLPEIVRFKETLQSISTSILLSKALLKIRLAKAKLRDASTLLGGYIVERQASAHARVTGKTISEDLEDIAESVLVLQQAVHLSG